MSIITGVETTRTRLSTHHEERESVEVLTAIDAKKMSFTNFKEVVRASRAHVVVRCCWQSFQVRERHLEERTHDELWPGARHHTTSVLRTTSPPAVGREECRGNSTCQPNLTTPQHRTTRRNHRHDSTEWRCDVVDNLVTMSHRCVLAGQPTERKAVGAHKRHTSDTNIFWRIGREGCFFAGEGSLCDEICPCFSQLWRLSLM